MGRVMGLKNVIILRSRRDRLELLKGIDRVSIYDPFISPFSALDDVRGNVGYRYLDENGESSSVVRRVKNTEDRERDRSG